ncbi:DUF4142 domain-containing protein [Catenuloplanes atrovinosus]|uniref:Membrane protein n=1 Tax=Catenuloplanes atrovinosus TaxID=137266 RepID=A0AAE4CA39_9ACTN|nr:DUF4142 domain-containing protein [Catenuloplanes atrovinosus]MDR7276462.1 putative membrane protein [Catenuloplanes atrovinosus]
MRILSTLSAALLAGAMLTVGAPAAASAPICAEDVKYLVRAHRGNLAEQAAGRAALAESANETVRQIATTLVADHGRLDAKIDRLAERHRVTLPRKPNQQQRDDLAAVVAKDGAEFDAAWLAMQQKAHVHTLDYIARELAGGCAPAVRATAMAASVPVTHHLDLVLAALKD